MTGYLAFVQMKRLGQSEGKVVVSAKLHLLYIENHD